MTPETVGDVVCGFAHADEAEMLRALLSAGMAVLAVQNVGNAPVRAALRSAIEPFRTRAGTYRSRTSGTA